MVVDAALVPLHAPPADLDPQRLESSLGEQTHGQFVVPRRGPVHSDAGEEIDGRLGLKVSPPRLLIVAVLWPGAIKLRRVHIRPVRWGGRRHGHRSPDEQRDHDQAIHQHILFAGGKILGGWQVLASAVGQYTGAIRASPPCSRIATAAQLVHCGSWTRMPPPPRDSASFLRYQCWHNTAVVASKMLSCIWYGWENFGTTFPSKLECADEDSLVRGEQRPAGGLRDGDDRRMF